MGDTAETVAAEKHPEAAAKKNRAATSPEPLLDPFLQSVVNGSNNPSSKAVVQSLSIAGLKTPVLQRAQRAYGNRISQQILMRAHALQRQCDCGGTCDKCQAEHVIPATQGQPLGETHRRPLENHFQTDLSDVRVHTDNEAAESSKHLDALAYTSGREIYFASGMYAPSSTSGRRLLAHEVAHVVQQGTGKEPSIAAKSSRGAKIGAPDDPLESEADREAEQFISGIPPALTDEERKRREAVPVQRFIQRQPDKPAVDDLDQRVEAFRQLVKNAARRRLAMNRVALAQWETFLTTQLTPEQTKAQTFATLTEQLQRDAAPAVATRSVYEQWTQTHNPEMRYVLEQQIHGRFRACTGCHAMVRAADWGYSADKTGEEWLLPRERIGLANAQAMASVGLPALQTQTGTPNQNAITAPQIAVPPPQQAAPPKVDASRYPGTVATAEAVARVHPFLQQLGPEGYKVLPEESINTNASAQQILEDIRSKIPQRQADYLQLSNRIANGDVEYYELQEVFNSLLPLAQPDVQKRVREEIEAHERHQAILAGILTALSIALLLIPIVGPAVGMSTAVVGSTMAFTSLALGAGVLYQGAEGIRQGRNLFLGQGAYNIFTAEQRAQAGEVLLGGVLNVAFAALAIVGGVRGLAAAPEASTTSLQTTPRTIRMGPVTLTVAEDGAMMATHADFPDCFVIINEGRATGYMLVNGEFQVVGSKPFNPGARPGGPSTTAGPTGAGTAPVPAEQTVVTPSGQQVVIPATTLPPSSGLARIAVTPTGEITIVMGGPTTPITQLGAPGSLPMLPGTNLPQFGGPGTIPLLLPGPSNQAIYLGPSVPQGPFITPPPPTYQALPAGTPTTLKLNQVLNLRGEARWQAGEQYILEVYGGVPQVHRPVALSGGTYPVTTPGGRYTDVSSPGGRGTTLGLEVKTYQRWRTVEGQPVENSVPLSDKIREQVYKDVQLMANDPTFEPVWIFLDAPPHPDLVLLLKQVNIRWIHYPRPKATP